MGDGSPNPKQTLHLCISCAQVFTSIADWNEHANGPWPDMESASDSRVSIEPGDSVPGGVMVGHRKCTYPDETPDPVEWTDVRQGDLVWDGDAGRPAGIVGHRDDDSVDIEPFSGGTKHVARSKFLPGNRYRAVRMGVEE